MRFMTNIQLNTTIQILEGLKKECAAAFREFQNSQLQDKSLLLARYRALLDFFHNQINAAGRLEINSGEKSIALKQLQELRYVASLWSEEVYRIQLR